MKKIAKRILVLIISISIIISNTSSVFATSSDKTQKLDVNAVSEVVEGIKSYETVSVSQEEVIVEEIKILDFYGFPIENISNVSIKGNEIIYEFLLTDEIINTIRVEKKEDEVVLDIREGIIHNTLIYKTDGTILLDNNVVEITISDELEHSFVNENLENTRAITLEDSSADIMPCTGGFNWYSPSDAPSYLKNASYGTYTNTANVANVNLNVALENIALATIVSLLTSSSSLLGTFVGFTMTCLNELRRYNENSTRVSHKVYTATSSDSRRYLKRKTYVYANTNYQGGYTICYSYGLLI